MSVVDAVRLAFDGAAASRRRNPMDTLARVGLFTGATLAVLANECERLPLPARGNIKAKTYAVFTRPDKPGPFSRPLNSHLFMFDEEEFTASWSHLMECLDESRGSGDPRLIGIGSEEVDRLCYTAGLAYAAGVDLFWRGDRGTPGTAFEMTVGALVAQLTGRAEHGAIDISVPGAPGKERINVDITVGDESNPPVLAIPTKLTTRERIVQPYVHQHILNAARPGMYRGILCICSENNVMAPKGSPVETRTAEICWVQDTLVPSTIALYERYMSHLNLYYLDPPEPYLAGAYPAMPPVRRFSSLLLEDLPGLLRGNGE